MYSLSDWPDIPHSLCLFLLYFVILVILIIVISMEILAHSKVINGTWTFYIGHGKVMSVCGHFTLGYFQGCFSFDL